MRNKQALSFKETKKVVCGFFFFFFTTIQGFDGSAKFISRRKT
jgi:hypothetical protein